MCNLSYARARVHIRTQPSSIYEQWIEVEVKKKKDLCLVQFSRNYAMVPKKTFPIKTNKKNTTHFNTVAGVVCVSNSFAPFEIGSISS